MANIFQKGVSSIGGTPAVPTEVVDNTAANTITLAGNTIWDAFKGKQVADFVDAGDVRMVPHMDFEGTLGTREVGEPVFKAIPTEALDSPHNLGLNQLQLAVDQGAITQDQADILAERRGRSFINRLPGIAPDIRNELSLFRMGREKSKYGRRLGKDGKGKGRDFSPETALEEGQFNAIKKLNEQAVSTGTTPQAVIRRNALVAENEVKKQQALAYTEGAEDLAASQYNLSISGIEEDLLSINTQFQSGGITAPQAELAYQATVQGRRKQLKDEMLSYSASMPADSQSEILEASNAAVVRFDAFVEPLSKLSALEQNEVILKAQQVSDATKLMSSELVRTNAAFKFMGHNEAIAPFTDAWMRGDKRATDLVRRTYNMSPEAATDVANAVVRGTPVIVNTPLQDIIGNPSQPEAAYETSTGFTVLSGVQPGATPASGTDLIPTSAAADPKRKLKMGLPQTVTRLIKNAELDPSNNIWEAWANKSIDYITNTVRGDPESEEAVTNLINTTLAQGLQRYESTKIEARLATEAVGDIGPASTDLDILSKGTTFGVSALSSREATQAKDRLKYQIQTIINNPGLFPDGEALIRAQAKKRDIDIKDILPTVTTKSPGAGASGKFTDPATGEWEDSGIIDILIDKLSGISTFFNGSVEERRSMMEGLGIPPSLIGPNIHIALTKADEISARLARPQESNVVSPFPENFDRRAGVIAGARDSVDAPVGKPTEQVQRPSIVSPFPEDFDRRSDVIAVAIPRKNGPPKIELPQWSSKSPKATQTVTNAHKADTNFVEVVPTINFVEDTRTDSKVDKLYEGLTSAETGGEKDPFIRTKVSNAPGGSSAYGPVQITGTLARDMVARYANEFTREEKDYLDKFINQAQVFLAYGNEPTREGYKPIYDYGGVGDLTSVKDKRLYRQVAKKMISIQLQEVGDDTNAFIRRWRGTAPEEWYLKKIKTVVGDI